MLMKLTINQLRRIIKEELEKSGTEITDEILKKIKDENTFGHDFNLKKWKEYFPENSEIFQDIFTAAYQDNNVWSKIRKSLGLMSDDYPKEAWKAFQAKDSNLGINIYFTSYTPISIKDAGDADEDETKVFHWYAGLHLKDQDVYIAEFYRYFSSPRWLEGDGYDNRDEELKKVAQENPPTWLSNESSKKSDSQKNSASSGSISSSGGSASSASPSASSSSGSGKSNPKEKIPRIAVDVATKLGWTEDGKLKKNIVKSGKSAALQNILITLEKMGKLGEALERGALKFQIDENVLRRIIRS
jgi:hypothetical protein